ncbi:hypothetical protein SH528x_003601 [Novipirellula sp. SH528]|uniref:hypothetical protein n=1 Tax=Novipirellula sp. SH528 TaxID=3454466 RepID=UPI003F9F519C
MQTLSFVSIASIALIATTVLALEETDTPRETKIVVAKIEKQTIALSGEATSDHELVLRLGRTKRTKQLEWSSPLNGKFDAKFSATDKLPLGDEKLGKGIVFEFTTTGNGGGTVGGITNIAMSDRDPVPNGVVRLRTNQPKSKKVPALKQVGDAITFADIVCDDGTEIPVSVLVRERQIAKP